MKKVWIISAIVVVVLVSLGVAGYAYAKTRLPLYQSNPQGPGNWGPGLGGRGGRGMMGGRFAGQGTYGVLHPYMLNAWAEAFDMTPEALQERLNAGDTMWTIAQEKGYSAEEFQKLWVEVRTQAINKAVEDGVITQQQADWMLERMDDMGKFGGRFGGCPGMGGRFGPGPGRGPRGPWTPQPTPTQPSS